MKNSFKGVVAGIAAMCFLTGCKNSDSSLIGEENQQYIKEIFAAVKADPSFAWAPVQGSVNLAGLKPNTVDEPTLLTIGTGVAAGYRNGGLFRQGQLTSYPNLVARQMGLAKFNQALFDEQEGNGTGFLVKNDILDLPQWSKVTNNTAYVEASEWNMKPYSKGIVHNLSVPGNHPNKYFLNPGEDLGNIVGFFEKNPKLDTKQRPENLWTSNEIPTSLLSRIIPKGNGSVWNYLNGVNPDVAIVDINSDIYVFSHIHGGARGILGIRESLWEVEILKYLKGKGTKYVYATVPDVLDFPYFKWYNNENLTKKTGKRISIMKDGAVQAIQGTNATIYLPTQNVINLYNGKAGDSFALLDADVITEEEASSPERYNELIYKWSKEYNYPVVDFYTIYKRILAGNYVSEDGYKIDPSWNGGNFFSADGIYPSAIGQAVLANEVIKVLNMTYHSRIPLINIGSFAKEMQKVQ